MRTEDSSRTRAWRRRTAFHGERFRRSSTAPGPDRRDRPGAMRTSTSQIERFLDHLAAERGLSPHTLAAYRRDLLRYGAFLEARGIEDAARATEDDAAGFVVHLSAGRTREGKQGTDRPARQVRAGRPAHVPGGRTAVTRVEVVGTGPVPESSRRSPDPAGVRPYPPRSRPESRPAEASQRAHP